MTMTDSSTKTITSERLRQLRDEDPGLRILDVRTGGEFETGHIPGSFNVPLDMLGEHVGELARVDHSIVLVCQSGGRATKACDRLTTAGKGEVYVLDGGMNSWQSTGGDVAAGEKRRWAMDRQVRLVAGSLVLAGVLASVAVPKAKWLSAGIGAGLLFSAVTDTCAMAGMLAKLPYNRTEPGDFGAVLEQLEEAA